MKFEYDDSLLSDGLTYTAFEKFKIFLPEFDEPTRKRIEHMFNRNSQTKAKLLKLMHRYMTARHIGKTHNQSWQEASA